MVLVHSKAVVLLLLICCLVCFPLVVGGSVFVFVLLCITLCPFYFCNHLEEEERAVYFAFNDLRMSCYCICSATLPYGVVGWSSECNIGIYQPPLILTELFQPNQINVSYLTA